MRVKKVAGVLALAGLVVPGIAGATNGYFGHGYGMKAKGMAGVGIALPQDSLAAATNPAGMAFVGSRMDLGLDWFRPQRETQLGGTFGPFSSTYDGNDTSNFFIPEFGYNRAFGPKMTLGVSVYGNGGMNTDYADLNSRTRGINPLAPPTNGLLGNGPVGVDLMQLFIAPTWTYKINDQHAVGISLNIAYQRFAADGLQNFDFPGVTSSPGNVTNRGHDDSWGWGVRIGWTGRLTDSVTLGATYQSKTSMSKFDSYKGLFAEQGDFDIPENYGIGIAFKATPALTVAGDIQWINYGDIKSIANPMISTQMLGDSSGPGFGWRDMTVYKLGVAYEYSKSLTLRAGYSYGRQPIPSDQTFFNILAPGVVEDHLTLGATWTLANQHELTVGYMHAFSKTVNGSGATRDINLQMYQDSLGIAYGWKM